MRAATAIALLTGAALARAATPVVEYNRDVRPILSDRCFTCHGPDSTSRKSLLRLDQEASARTALANGEVLRRITSTDTSKRMPPAYLDRERLPDAEIDILRRWIEQGAKYQPHWSLIPPQRPSPPVVKDKAWSRQPIDRFVLARLDREGLQRSPEADRETLLRRVTLDLTGLPPAPVDTAAFLKDRSAR